MRERSPGEWDLARNMCATWNAVVGTGQARGLPCIEPPATANQTPVPRPGRSENMSKTKKPKTTKVYKVVRVCGGRLLSAFSPFRVQYVVGRFAVPKIEGTRLFAFRRLKDAKEYRRDLDRIYKAEATGVQNSRAWINLLLSKSQLARFDSCLRGNPYEMPSAVTCTSIKLVKKI